MSTNLRDFLLSALSSLPGTRQFHLHVLVSSPRKYTSLYPYATTRPRVYAQDIFVLLSEQRDLSSPRVFVTAIEANVYNIPQTSSAILYVSKVDSTGQGAKPAPTAALVRALLKFYIDPQTRPLAAERLWVHLFARAQGQYLFPNSSDHDAKKPLSDVKLCSWWKRLFSQVAVEAMASRRNSEPQAPSSSSSSNANLSEEMPKLYFVMPGMNELEALQGLGELSAVSTAAADDSKRAAWTYGHPYSQKDIPLPYQIHGKDTRHNLGHFIPSFEDDPKTRFMDEIACTTKMDGVPSPKRKRRRISEEGQAEVGGGGVQTTKDKDHGDGERIHGELGQVQPDEFWERMGFRQECVAGAITGFFVAVYPWSSTATFSSSPSPLAPQPGQVSHQLIRRIVTSLMTGHEFSTTERSVFATETLEGVIKGLCEGLPTASQSQPMVIKSTTTNDDKARDKTPERDVAAIPPQLLAPPSTPPPRMINGKRALPFDNDNISPNPFPEPVASLETYSSYIFGELSIHNPEPVRGNADGVTAVGRSENGALVTVLAVRKKVKQKR